MRIVNLLLTATIFISISFSIVYAEVNDVLFDSRDNESKTVIDNKSKIDNITVERNLLKITKHGKKEEPYAVKLSLSASALGIIDLINSSTKINQNFTLIPYATLHLRIMNGAPFIPEIIISESGIFNFDKAGIRIGSKRNGYNSYYIKMPLMLNVPFFSYSSMLNIDFRYLTTVSSININGALTANNRSISSGDVSLTGSILEGRIYLDSPIVINPTFFNHSYAGIYYTEISAIRLATPYLAGTGDYLLSTTTRGGGFFYDMSVDTPLNGLDFAITLKLGYGDVHVNDRYDLSYGNIYNLLLFTIKAGVSYRYVFNNYFAMRLDAGVSYVSINSFFTTPIVGRYSVALGGNILYNFGLSFIF